jgi:dicarboxylate/amino acid:cation (Na+ or H+) symporter, DAACS family
MRKDDPNGGGLDTPDYFEQETTTDLDDKTPDKPRGLPLHTRILIGLGVGIGAGLLADTLFGGNDSRVQWIIANITEPIGQLFLRLLLMIVVPLVFSSLVVGIAGLGDIRKIGRVGVRSILYSLVISTISVVIGLTLANAIRPGDRVDRASRAKIEERYSLAASKQVEEASKTAAANKDSAVVQVIKSIVPSNPIAALASDPPNILQLMFFSLALGIATTLVPATVSAPFLRGLQALYEITAKVIDMVMKFAPYAVACLLFNNSARFGLDLLSALGWFVATVLIGLTLQMFGVYSLSVYLLSRLSPLDFFRRIKTIILTAFSTSSSNATLPTALRVTEENLGVPREINSFVLTVGATANQNGTAIYEGVTVLFLAQLAGIHLSLGQQIAVVYLAILGSIGTAGVPSGSIPFIIAVLATVGVNPALIAIVLGVDRLLDMCRTTVNVAGDVTAATYVARAEGYSLLQSQRNAGKRKGGF